MSIAARSTLKILQMTIYVIRRLEFFIPTETKPIHAHEAATATSNAVILTKGLTGKESTLGTKSSNRSSANGTRISGRVAQPQSLRLYRKKTIVINTNIAVMMQHSIAMMSLLCYKLHSRISAEYVSRCCTISAHSKINRAAVYLYKALIELVHLIGRIIGIGVLLLLDALVE